ncbi:trypsin-like peptidase domain-containing protein [Treponema sp. OttesenSCG-928-L16]|nr:trypsin-like peptidase domain-containing protein [Treponema sp. OttesenSCG-928-L16]
MNRNLYGRTALVCSLLIINSAVIFGQTSALRNYVGVIHQSYHPDIVEYMNKFKEEFEKGGNSDAVKGVDQFLKGSFGSGFVYVDEKGDNFIITNLHVVNQSYTLSISFEKSDGTQTKYEGLRIIAADEELDIAVLAFKEGEKPFTEGLAFLNRQAEEGEDVYSAGFPGLGGNPLWQLGRGMISNAIARIPSDEDEDVLVGPYIQHTAQVDFGNSGGPLLVPQEGVPTGYGVIGINTLSYRSRQAANYSVPSTRALEFINKIAGGEPVGTREDLEETVDAFMAGLGVPKAVYAHIAKYLSNACTAQNAEWALSEVLDKATRTVRNDIITIFAYYPIDGMNYAVAWTIENSMRTSTGPIKISLESITEKSDSAYTVRFSINGETVSSEWAREFGMWRVDSFAEVASGNKTLVENKKKQREISARLRTDFSFMIAAGYTYIIDRGSALNAALRISPADYSMWGINFYFAGPEYMQFEAAYGIFIPIRLSSAAIIPALQFGMGFMKKDYENDRDDDFNLAFGLSVQPGIMVTTSAVPGLYFMANYQFNWYLSSDDTKPDKHMISAGIGYAF